MIDDPLNVYIFEPLRFFEGKLEAQKIRFAGEPALEHYLYWDIDTHRIAEPLIRLKQFLKIKPCALGELSSSDNGICHACEGYNFMRLDSTSDCLTCPAHAECFDGLFLTANEGFQKVYPQGSEVTIFRDDDKSLIPSDAFVACPKLGSVQPCLDGNQCLAGYEGNMCNQCSSGYFKTMDGQCNSCNISNSFFQNLTKIMILIGLLSIVYLIYKGFTYSQFHQYHSSTRSLLVLLIDFAVLFALIHRIFERSLRGSKAFEATFTIMRKY